VCVCVHVCLYVWLFFVCSGFVARQHPHNAPRRSDPWVQMLLLLLCGAGIADPLLPSPTHTHQDFKAPDSTQPYRLNSQPTVENCAVPFQLQPGLAIAAPMEQEDEADRLDQLRAERVEIKKREKMLKAQLQQAKKVQEQSERAWKLSAFMIHVVLISYALCEYKAPAAVKYLTVTGRKRKWPERTESELKEMVERLFVECDVDKLADLTSKASPAEPDAFAVAARLSEEWAMATFVEDCNLRLGLAPSTDSLLHRWRQQSASYPEAVRPRDIGVVSEARARKWAQRWRERWNAWYGGIRIRDEVPVEEARAKAEIPSVPSAD
jgi:hypothetical protein